MELYRFFFGFFRKFKFNYNWTSKSNEQHVVFIGTPGAKTSPISPVKSSGAYTAASYTHIKEILISSLTAVAVLVTPREDYIC